MKLHFKENETKGGWFSSKEFELFTKVEMTEQEQAAYREVEDEIKHYIIAEYEYKGVELNMDIGQLIYSSKKNDDGFRMAFSGRQYVGPMKEEIQRGVAAFSDHLKGVIEGGSFGGESVIEL